MPFFSFKYLRGTICSIVLLFFGAFNLYFTLQGYVFLILAFFFGAINLYLTPRGYAFSILSCFPWCFQLIFYTSGVRFLNSRMLSLVLSTCILHLRGTISKFPHSTLVLSSRISNFRGKMQKELPENINKILRKF